MNTDILWNNFLDKIKDRISPLSYDTWFKDTKLYKIDKSTASKKSEEPEEKSPIMRWLKKLFSRPEHAAKEFKADPKQADVHFTLGLSMSETESFLEQACREFKLALKFDPNHREACYNMALMQYKTGDFDGARASLRRCLEIDPQDPAAKVLSSLLQ